MQRGVKVKLMEGDTRGAVIEFCSRNALAPFSTETLAALQNKYTPAPAVINLPLSPKESIQQPKTVSKKDINKAIDSFKLGSATGPDGLRLCHPRQLVCMSVRETGKWLLRTLAVFVNLVPEHMKDSFYGANLCTFKGAVAEIWVKMFYFFVFFLLAKIYP